MSFLVTQYRRTTRTNLLSGLALTLCATVLISCSSTPVSIEEQVDKEYKRTDAAQVLVEEFIAKQRHCVRRGGYMVFAMGSGGKVDRRTMELAYCEY